MVWALSMTYSFYPTVGGDDSYLDRFDEGGR